MELDGAPPNEVRLKGNQDVGDRELVVEVAGADNEGASG